MGACSSTSTSISSEHEEHLHDKASKPTVRSPAPQELHEQQQQQRDSSNSVSSKYRLEVNTRPLAVGVDDEQGGHLPPPSPVPFPEGQPRKQRQLSLPSYDDDSQAKQYAALRGADSRRNSIMEYVSQVRQVQEETLEFQHAKRTGTIDNSHNLKFLPRGGTYVMTSAGAIQFGMPPETIKDSMQLGLDVPQYFVLPRERFSLSTGINVAEFEFPAYFNFFVLRRKTILVVEREVEASIRTIFQETLLGPEEIEKPTEYSDKVPEEAYPDLRRELAHFGKNPFNRSEDLSIDALLDFIYFEDGKATIGDVQITDDGTEYTVMDGDSELAKVAGYVILSPPVVGGGVSHDDAQPPQFVPPAFGITMLGNSHGFDSAGTTTGFVLWMNRRGIMVDPPPYSGAILRQHGIPSRLIRGIILTHCHADHDAGTFQKILEEGRITLYTTPVIKGSFLRKYSAVSGLDVEFLEKLFEFHPVVIGRRFSVYGGELEFFYSLHSIPCAAFSAYCCGKSMVYSGDTFNDPAGIAKLAEQGVLTPGRAEALSNFPWHHDIILHEAGVPPIHTPMTTLTELPEDVKERLYVVHVAGKDIPADSGLRTALVGPENTIVIQDERPPEFESMEILDLISNIELFADLKISQAVRALNAVHMQKREAGHVIIEQNSFGELMFIIAMGTVRVEVDGNLIKRLHCGDHFGEMSIVTHNKRTATITCDTDCELLEVRGHEFLRLVEGTNAVTRLQHLGLMQKEESWQVICANSVLGQFSSSQKTYLQSILQRVEATRGDVVWERGEEGKFAVLVESGRFVFERAKELEPFERGCFIGEVDTLLHSRPISTTLICADDGAFFFITKRKLNRFVQDNPGVLLALQGRRFVE